MSVFKEETETKRVIFNIQIDLAQKLETAKKDARKIGKKLDADSSINKALEKFLKKAEKKIEEVKKKKGIIEQEPDDDADISSEPAEEDNPMNEFNESHENLEDKNEK